MTVSRSQFQKHNNPKAKGMHNVFYHEKFRKKNSALEAQRR